MQLVRPTYLSIGSNQGDRLQFLQKALDAIDENIGRVVRVSSVYKAASWGFSSEDFFNICVEISTHLNPENLLTSLHQIERSMGRERNSKPNYEARTIDIDILIFDNEIIFSQELIVPHKGMLERNFVMVPLAEIAPNLRHPINKKRMQFLMEQCDDTSAVEPTEEILIRPISLSEKYNYIAIEGNIGAGKSSLAKMIAEDYNAKIVAERFKDNPFLPKFYKDKNRFAFPLEMSFLADRYQQLTEDLAQYDLFKNFVVSDYYIFKSLLFAQVTLQNDEYYLYRKMFDVIYKEISKPDLYIYLSQNSDRLVENIKKRGREYEQNIEPEYLEQIHQGYSNFIKTEQGLNTLIIDINDLDFVNNPEDYKSILKLIKKHE
jgi:2-amino-4-hydroxy-6-hydroxymethyldihydropteridine diphosphokinase